MNRGFEERFLSKPFSSLSIECLALAPTPICGISLSRRGIFFYWRCSAMEAVLPPGIARLGPDALLETLNL